MRGIKQIGEPRAAGRRTPRLDVVSATVLEEWMLQHQGVSCHTPAHTEPALNSHMLILSLSLTTANPFPTPSQKMELAKSTGLSFHQVGTWMTNNRKRRLYPITSGRRKPKTCFDRRILAQHNRHASAKVFQCYSPVRRDRRPEATEGGSNLPAYECLHDMLYSPESTETRPDDGQGGAKEMGVGWYSDGAFGAGSCEDMQFYENDFPSKEDLMMEGSISGGIM